MQNRSLSLPTVYMHTQPSLPSYPSNGIESGELTILDVTYLHFHHTLEIGLCVSGEGICYIDDQEQPFQSGDIQIIFPFQRHLSKSTGEVPCKWYWLYVDANAALAENGTIGVAEASRMLREEMGLCGIIDRVQYPRICDLAERILAEFGDPDPHKLHRTAYFSALLQTLLLEMCDASASVEKIKPVRDGGILLITPALEAIKEGLDNGCLPTVDALSSRCGMSAATFRRRFRLATGQAPKEYVTECAIRRAVKLLLDTDRKITDIAETVGFPEISTFNRCFAKATGITPREYRKKKGCQ